MLVTVKPTGAKMELLLSIRFLHPLHVDQALNSTVYINVTSLLKDLAEIITHNFTQIFTFITALLSIHSFYKMHILQSQRIPQNGTL
jgi:serine phosphatase RsbU (regulator of sigma subunit)